MAELTAVASQTVESGQSIVFNGDINKRCILHQNGSSITKLRGITNQCNAAFLVEFCGNIQIPTGGTVEAISLAISVDGEPLQATSMIVTPAAVENAFNVSAQTEIKIPQGCCSSIAIRNTSSQAIEIVTGNMIPTRIS